RKTSLARVETSDAVWVGRWLQCHTPRSSRIAYDYFSYVPVSFGDAHPTWGGTLTWLADIDPDVVIVHSLISDHIFENYATGAADHAAYYAAIANGRAGFDLVLTHEKL